MITIKDIRTIVTAPDGVNLIVVKVFTSEPGLYGLGCATFTQRHVAVVSILDNYLKPFLLGKDVTQIEDIWNTALVCGYWRNGPEFNNALSGIDMALWDIKGKIANMPLYQLLGGKCRNGVPLYRHAEGSNHEKLKEKVTELLEEGYQHIRCKMSSSNVDSIDPRSCNSVFNPKGYMRSTIDMFAYLRKEFGWEIEFIHDVHERLAPIDAVGFTKKLEQYDLYFLEDVLPPEQKDWLKQIRQNTTTPIAMGELFNNPNEWIPLITQRFIDFIRVHVSQIGGVTPAKKVISMCEAFGIRTALHGPLDLSPVGHAANIHLDISCINFGIQEWQYVSDSMYEIFPGCPEVENGCAYPNDKPGLGIEINEKLAVKYPPSTKTPAWTLTRLQDGTAIRP
ncbi:enolase C-terminal domain-like protein [Sporosarcina psychrophila]|uniref:enolase C-terminal domain-like protein n=1 Tax=Sporosarcina psychrophila TaxID=1476 RepID=UPI00078C4C79|nr:enolase C-terminal domain-like protein [Sporosarcina psychrophila]AMQ07700.1 2-dehydro-3-deoxy-6-phosphogalactonate aldolase [Sporosarcina psychrophila]